MAQARPPRQPDPPQPLSGGPGVDPEELSPLEPTGPDTPPPTTEPSGTVIRIGSREFTVEPELADAFESHRRETDRKFGEQGRELGDHRAWRREVESRLPPKTEPAARNYDSTLFERPTETLAEIEERAVKRAKDEMRLEYQGDQTQRANWARFYKLHPDLADEDRLVRTVLQDLYGQGWATRHESEMPAFMDELAKQTRGELLRISRKTREADTPSERLPRGRTPVEGGGGNRRTPAPVEPDEPITLVGEIQRRQRSRQRRAVAE